MIRFCLETFLLICLATLAVGQESGGEFSIRQLLQRYTETYGGLRDANQLASISIEGKQTQRGVKYSFHIRKKRPASMRYQLERGDTSLTSIYDGRRGWLLTKKDGRMSTEELSGSALEVLKEEARFESPLYRHLEKPENEISFKGREQIGGVATHVLQVNEPGSSPSLYFLQSDNAHVLRIDRLNDQGEVVFQTLYRDYKIVGGYPFAHEVENRVNGETISITRVESILVNPGLLSFYFENPEN